MPRERAVANLGSRFQCAFQHDGLGPIAGQLATIALGEPSALPKESADSLLAMTDRRSRVAPHERASEQAWR